MARFPSKYGLFGKKGFMQSTNHRKTAPTGPNPRKFSWVCRMIAGMMLVSLVAGSVSFGQARAEQASKQTSLQQHIDQETEAALCPKTQTDSRTKPVSIFFFAVWAWSYHSSIIFVSPQFGRLSRVTDDLLHLRLLQRLYPFHSFP